jgi:uncharacterized protein YjbJ (UPF0337 family)
MNKLNMQGNRHELAGKFKQKIANLTHDGLLFQDNKEEELSGRMQKKPGKAKEQICSLIEKL